MKTRIISTVLALASAVCLFGQAEQVKSKAKDLKKKIEAQQTNQVGVATNAPTKPPTKRF